MPRHVFILLLALAFWPGQAQAETLKYSVEGVRGPLKKNITAWLGADPETPEERSNFIASAEERITQSLKALGYYRPDIEIELSKTSSPWKMLVTVTPNSPVRIENLEIQLLGEAADDPEFARLLDSPPFGPGDILHHGVYDDFKKTLIALGQQRGYFDGVIDNSRVEVNVDDSVATVRLRYNSGQRYRYGDVHIDQSVMDMSWVDSVLDFKRGDLFDLGELQLLRAQLQQTRYFSTVIVRPQLDERENGHVPVVVNVSPAVRHSFEFGVGFSTDTQERISATWRTPMLNRYGHSQETRYEYSSVSPGGRFVYSIPLSHPLNDVLHLSAYLEDREYGDLDSRQKGVGARREIKRGKWIGSYSLRTLDESWQVDEVHRDNSYVLPGASLSHKSRSGSLVNPEAGFHQVYLVEGGSEEIGSDINLLRAYANYRLVVPLALRHRLVARGELGAVFIDGSDRADLAPSLSFFTGGSQSIRGFSFQSIGNEVAVDLPDGSSRSLVVGGDRLVTASVEYQYSFNDTWRGAIFADAGDAFDEGEFRAHYGAGFGVHYMSPVGAIRLELANNLSEDDPSWRIHLNIGAEF